MNDSRIPLNGLEVNIVYVCNLKCEYCTHLGKYLEGHVSLEEIVSWYHAWHRKVIPGGLTILGGEPLLHPELAEVLYATKRYWQDSEIQMVTNGLLIPNMSENVWDALKETGIKVAVSRHFVSEKYRRKYDIGIRLLEKKGIRYEDRPSHSWWIKSYRLDDSGKVLPYSSDPEKAWKNCFVKNNCMTLMENRIYKCPQLACFSLACRTGILSEEWSPILESRTLTAECSEREIREFVNKKSVPECRICPEVFEYVNASEKQGLLS